MNNTPVTAYGIVLTRAEIKALREVLTVPTRVPVVLPPGRVALLKSILEKLPP